MPVYFAQNVQAISIYNPATGEVEQFDLIEGDTFSVTEAPIQMGVQANKQITTKKLLTFNARLFDRGASFDMLRMWEDNLTPVNIVAAGQPNLQWYENSYIQIEDVTEEEDGLWGFTVTCQAEQFFGFETIFMKQNLLAFKGWEDVDNDGEVDNYNIHSSYVSLTFPNGKQTANIGEPNRNISRNIIYPISGITITLSNNFINVHTDTNSMNLGTREEDFSRNVLNLFNEEFGTGIHSISTTTASNLFLFVAQILRTPGSVVNADDLAFQFPALTTNGAVTPGTKFMDW